MKFKIVHNIWSRGTDAPQYEESYSLKHFVGADNTTGDNSWWEFIGRFSTVEAAKSFAVRYMKLIETPLELDI